MSPHRSDYSTNIQIPTDNTLGSYISIKKDPIVMVREKYNIAYSHNSKQRLLLNKLYQAYHGYVKDSARSKGRANFHYHKMFQAVETEVARFMVNYFSHDPYASVIPNKGAAVNSAKAMEEVLQYYYEHSPNFFLSRLRMIKYASLFGYGWCVPSWQKDEMKVKVRKKVKLYGMDVGEIEEEELQIIYEGLQFDVYSPTEVFTDPMAKTPNKMRWAMVEDWVPAEELAEKANQGIYDKAAVNRIPLNGSGQEQIEYQNRVDSLGYVRPDEDISMVRLWSYFEANRWITVANDDTIIRDEENPYDHKQIPLIMGMKTVDIDSFFPIGTGKVILPTQKMVNVVVNSAIDSVISSNHPIWKHKSHIDPNGLASLPNKRIRVRQMDDVEIMRMPETKQDIYQLKNTLEESINESTGYYNQQFGGGSPNTTATGAQINNDQGNQRIQYDVMVFEELYLVKEAKMCTKIIQQMIPEGQEFRIAGQGGMNFANYSAEDIRGEFKTRGSSEAINKAVVQQQLINFFNMSNQATQYVTMPTGEVVPVPVLDTYNALKDIYEGFGRKDTYKLLLRPELFGIPISNEVLGQFGLPPIPGLEGKQSNPLTGGFGGPTVNPKTLPSSTNETQITRNATQLPNPTRAVNV